MLQASAQNLYGSTAVHAQLQSSLACSGIAREEFWIIVLHALEMD
jgi:hypothetical protein